VDEAADVSDADRFYWFFVANGNTIVFCKDNKIVRRMSEKKTALVESQKSPAVDTIG
jgi:hypothetical protein